MEGKHYIKKSKMMPMRVVVRRDGGDRGCGGYNGQGVMMKRDMEVTEVVDEDALDRLAW